jgi:hypothetical protein
MSPAQLERLDFDRLTKWTKEATQLLSLTIDRAITDQSKDYQVQYFLQTFFFKRLFASMK